MISESTLTSKGVRGQAEFQALSFRLVELDLSDAAKA
jgi:hypothetical protein